MAAAQRKKSSIPGEIIFEIFNWLPVKSLMRFKCVSRFCNSLISDPYFREIHRSHFSLYGHNHHKTIKFLGLSKKNFYTLKLGRITKASTFHVDEKLDLITYSNSAYAKGLLCLWNRYSVVHPVIILNPSTRETRFLPCLSSVAEELAYLKNGSYKCYISLGFDSEKRRHKILMTLFDVGLYPRLTTRANNVPSNKLRTRNWVFTLGTSGESWREIKSSMPYCEPLMVQGVDIDGVVYFLIITDTSKIGIVAFNVITEEFRIISSLWDEQLSYTHMLTTCLLVEIEGKLAAIDTSPCWNDTWNRGKQAHFWLLQSRPPADDRWVHHELLVSEKEEFCINKNYFTVSFFTRLKHMIFLYDLKKKWWRAIEIMGLARNSEITAIYCYNEDSLYSL